MSSWTNNAKSAAASVSNVSKNSGTVYNLQKAGAGGQVYDSYLTYDEMIDPLTGLAVTYDGLGTLPVWTNQAKN